ncbi:hypothetical protein F3Y22_tig00110540pilonHSYRG00064 [Hibiscus syriacus]|uniref:Uncharacterized protein n=1 Tax=Hibiscus syriacus TaxID=106335 RepID=A0A6A3ABX4_HIBSY|nr:hypothetical protein F3Y22_tig00110540pilonHSYRG00064 [Hibiscus syriacus]
MLLRSSSTPILKTCVPQNPAAVDRIPSKNVSLTPSPINKIQRTSSDGNVRHFAIPNRHKLSHMGSPNTVKEEEDIPFQRVSSSLHADGGGGDWGQGKQRMDEYYQNMIRTYPGEALLLTNYSKFLREVQGDLLKAEEYCRKAVVVRPDDGEVLSMYGDLIWVNHGDKALAQSYFDRAVKASPNNCHVLASYARYLWTAEKDDD